MKSLSREAFVEKHTIGNDIIMIVPKPGTQERIMIYMIIEETKNINHRLIAIMADKMKEKGICDGIILSNASLSPPAEKLLNDMEAEAGLRLEYFQFKEMLVNITKHELVPKHEVLGNHEKD